ncbi:Activity-Dependent Neuroprotector Homeobox Protein 2 [Manis pentadactyla]|nr:Activity-Dependent Neuroprotector Homeobox Protein 2 [Manis pentadactyla]
MDASVALLRLGGICEHKREDVGIQEAFSEKGASGVLAGDSPEVRASKIWALGVGNKNRSDAPARNTAAVKEKKKERQMRKKLLKKNEAVEAERRDQQAFSEVVLRSGNWNNPFGPRALPLNSSVTPE